MQILPDKCVFVFDVGAPFILQRNVDKIKIVIWIVALLGALIWNLKEKKIKF